MSSHPSRSTPVIAPSTARTSSRCNHVGPPVGAIAVSTAAACNLTSSSLGWCPSRSAGVDVTPINPADDRETEQSSGLTHARRETFALKPRSALAMSIPEVRPLLRRCKLQGPQDESQLARYL